MSGKRTKKGEPAIRMKRIPQGWVVTLWPPHLVAGVAQQAFDTEADGLAYAERLSARTGVPFAYTAPRTDARE